MPKDDIVSNDDILLVLCGSMQSVLSSATNQKIDYSGMVQVIEKTGLKPDIGCFVLFDGGFSGLVIMNFSAAAAMEIYTNYMLYMGLPKEDLATSHVSDEVSNTLGELMNQIVGNFTGEIGLQLQTSITQNQPKMLTISKQVLIAVDVKLSRPQARRVTFMTESNHPFYLELAMDKTEFIKLSNFKEHEKTDPDELIAQEKNKMQINSDNKTEQGQDLLDTLGI